MGFQINTNTAANTAYRNLSNTQNDISKSLEKLSSGLRINRAADDAAGLSIAEGLRSQVNGLGVAARNAQDGISVVQTAEGALTEVHSILQRVRDLSVQAGNDSNNADARTAIATEVSALTDELDRIGKSTNFNGISLLNSGNELKFQVGAGSSADTDQIKVKLTDVSDIAKTLGSGNIGSTATKFDVADVTALTGGVQTFTTVKGGATTEVATAALTPPGGGANFASVEDYAKALRADASFAANFSVTVEKDANGAGTAISVRALDGGAVSAGTAPGAGLGVGAAGAPVNGLKFDTAENAQLSIAAVDEQISAVSLARSELGAVQNRFESAINSINVSQENLSAAQSRIRDTDMAKEMADFTRSNILSQAGTAMLSQANQMNQGVLQLLR
ncbi:flagellin [Arthrobacter agilis]|uniref:flagellin N-terminal helical domain-containing protein n=1 Tax=Arthrobacter agilis TaxID=37921 RepID=UPI0023656062|nr:flagellin [Arthrobacter agilis]WDF33755.1 flagellin [Arthrobacter agilis]